MNSAFNFELVLLANLTAAFYMLGLIWTIQLVHYPSFLSVEPRKFKEFHLAHSRQMGALAGLPMIVELVSSAALLFWNQNLIFWLNLMLIVALWLLTFLVSVPIHDKLSLEYSDLEVKNLIRTNWPRTLLWTCRTLLMLVVSLSNRWQIVNS